jgi:hypothetical protein
MHALQVWNEQALLRVLCDGRLELERKPGGEGLGGFDLQEGSVKVAGSAPVSGLLYYAVPCLHEKITVHVEGSATPAFEQAVGNWPAAVDEDELQTYPYLHFLEERKTGMPWRWERWYTLAGAYLIFDSEQYMERACPRQHGKDWERLIVQVRQVADVSTCAQGSARVMDHLLSGLGA